MTCYSKNQALALLAAAPDEIADNLGWWRGPDGKLGDKATRDEWRQGLLSGSVNPTDLVQAMRLQRSVIDVVRAKPLEKGGGT